MFSEIATKAWDAGQMFWASLSERERLALLSFGLYVTLALVGELAAVRRARERETLKAELKEELRAHQG